MSEVDWSIQDLARMVGTTSRTLRHYGDVGLLRPSRLGRNGYRYYDQEKLLRLQRILLLRELGLGLPAIAEVLDGSQHPVEALRTHLKLLEQERERIGRQIESVKTTLRKTEGGEPLMPEEMFDGFDHTQYEREVTERWGREAYAKGDRWWRSLSPAEKLAFQQRQIEIGRDFGAAHRAGAAADSDQVQAITQRLYDWLSGSSTTPTKEYFTGLGELYVSDPRYTAAFDNAENTAGTVTLIRDAMHVYAERNL
ncbi:TipAS antibiotic-recognition domain-containing protein [Micromonospora sp. NPDC049204]|uniref:MerR family transcriptional regulator n=1 Tax=unclassified Micromonospora TaxID=2617518 RepID=UPI0033D50C89